VKFTPKLVNEVAESVAYFTGDRFKMHPAAPSIGEGTRYVDYTRPQGWLGGQGAREACAYYIGGALGWAHATGKEIPEDITRQLMAVHGQIDIRTRAKWETEGRHRAQDLAKGEGLLRPGYTPATVEGAQHL
jgi:hypothetical protein